MKASQNVGSGKEAVGLPREQAGAYASNAAGIISDEERRPQEKCQQ